MLCVKTHGHAYIFHEWNQQVYIFAGTNLLYQNMCMRVPVYVCVFEV